MKERIPTSSGYPFSCDTSGIPRRPVHTRRMPDILDPDYSQPQPRERTVAWVALGTGLLITGALVAGCDSRTPEQPDLNQPVPAVTELTNQLQHDKSLLDALGPVALNG